MKRSALRVPRTRSALQLTPAEAVLAEFIAENQGITYDQTHRLLYGEPMPAGASPRDILTSARVLIHRLRHKVRDTGGVEILSHRGVGWYVAPDHQDTLAYLLDPSADRGDKTRSATGDAPSRVAGREAAQ